MAPQPAAAQEIKIGYSMAMTGGLGPNGQSALLAQKIWEEDINKKGGLLGRPVKLIYYDDQTNPSTVPGIYAKLLDVDKVDLIIGGYGTNMLAPAMPLVMQRKKLFIGLLGLGVNSEFNYPNYFVMIPSGPDPKPSFTKGFFDVAMAQNPKPHDDRHRRRRRRVRAQRRRRRTRERQQGRPEDRLRQDLSAGDHGLRADRARHRGDQSGRRGDRAPIRPTRSAWCASVNEIGFKPKMIGGGMVGPAEHLHQGAARAAAQRLDQLRLLAAGAEDAVSRASTDLMTEVPGQGRRGEGAIRSATTWRRRPMPRCRCWSRPSQATKSLDDQKLADYIRANTFKTVLGDVKFGKGGEWAGVAGAAGAVPQRQGQRRRAVQGRRHAGGGRPRDYASGKLIYPYEKAK